MSGRKHGSQQPAADVAGEAAPRISDEAVRRATGRGREEWFTLLDEWQAAERQHREIAAWLSAAHGVPGWWAQGITVAYEQARGLRAPGARRGGGFEVNLSRTMQVPVERLFAAVADAPLRERWLPGAPLRERTSSPPRSARFDWEEGATRIVFGFAPKGEGRSQLALTHERVPDLARADALRAFWVERLAVLKTVLEG